jgi:hypothetical protein
MEDRHTGTLHAVPQHQLDGERTSTSSLSWVAQLPLYIKATSNSSDAVQQQLRVKLADGVLESPNSAEAWHAFLQSEEAAVRRASAGGSSPPQQLLVGSKRLSLLYWYQRATELVPRSKGQAAEAYVGIWIGYARHQW